MENGKWRMENERGDLAFSIVWFIGAYGLQGRAMRAPTIFYMVQHNKPTGTPYLFSPYYYTKPVCGL